MKRKVGTCQFGEKGEGKNKKTRLGDKKGKKGKDEEGKKRKCGKTKRQKGKEKLGTGN